MKSWYKVGISPYQKFPFATPLCQFQLHDLHSLFFHYSGVRRPFRVRSARTGKSQFTAGIRRPVRRPVRRPPFVVRRGRGARTRENGRSTKRTCMTSVPRACVSKERGASRGSRRRDSGTLTRIKGGGWGEGGLRSTSNNKR